MFHNRQQLIKWAIENPPDVVIDRILATGEVKLLGGFNPVAGSEHPGFIVHICKYIGGFLKQDYYIGVAIDAGRHQIRSFRIKEPNWKDYIGHTSKIPLYQGDDYEKSYEAHTKAIRAT